MVNIVLRWLWTIFIGSWITPIWFLIGYLLVAIYVTKDAGFWIFKNISFVYSLERYDERMLEYPKAITSIIWFYLAGWFIGVFVIFLGTLLALTIIFFKRGAKMVHQMDVAVIAPP
jgi:hypothetical protein